MLLLFFLGTALASCLRVRPESFVPAGEHRAADERGDFLDGRPRSFLVLGDETSLVWPRLLQDMLDAHAKTPGLYRVFNASVVGARAARWTGRDDPALAELGARFFGQRPRGSAPAPTVALCQVTLAGIGDERGPVKSEHDMLGAEMGADVLERLVLELERLGVERVLFSTPLYREGSEPEGGLEHVAHERLLARDHESVRAGPDLWTPSFRYFPDGYEEDRVRPNEFGMKLMAEEWYRRLAGPEARESVVQALYARDYDIEALERAALEGAAPPEG